MKFLGILGLKKEINRQAEDLIDLIYDLDLDTCILGGNDEIVV